MNCCGQKPTSCATPNPTGNAMGTPEPHYIPGYLGYVPQAKYRPGHTFGVTSHRILLDPCIHMSPRSLLTNMSAQHCADDFGRPGLGADPFLQSQMALVNSRVNSFGRQQYQPNMTSGYTGFVPRMQTILGHTYSPSCNRALARFEQDQWRDRLFNKELEALDGWRFCYKSKPWESPEVQRPAGGDLQEFASPSCQRNDPMPVSMPVGGGCSSCSGSTGNRNTVNAQYSSYNSQPASSSSCGPMAPTRILTPSHPQCDYAERRMWGIATDRVLNKTCGGNSFRINSHKFIKPIQRVQQLYKDCEGMLPNYNGHVPGEQFRIGKTYGAATRNSRRVLEPPMHGPYCFPLPKNN